MSQHDPVIRKIPIQRAGTTLQTVCIADVEPKPISWLWPEKIARGKLTLISGDPGLGKSLITVALASAVSNGARWPVGGGNAPVGSVILLSDEDAIADTIRPRLDAAGANCSKVHAIQMVQETTEDGETINRSFNLALDVERLAAVVEKLGDVALIQIDPVSAYLGGTDSHKNADVRALLSPLSDLAERFNVAVVIVTHLNKGSGLAMYRSVGSIAFTAAARTAWAVTKDKDDPARRLMLPVKNNLGNDHSGIAYTVETADNDAPVVMWESNPVEIDINEALSNESNDEQWARSEVEDWLTDLLIGKPIPSNDVKKLAAEAGFSWRTVERAKASCRVKSKKDGMHGPWLWWHPNDIFQKTDEIPEVRPEGREDAPVLERGGLGGLRNQEVNI
ncbi:MAG: AAA family ATPase [Candidatus Poribacteria bacterium]|nr:AAA family ATPase [Candidatus Poribacteria bacterium]